MTKLSWGSENVGRFASFGYHSEIPAACAWAIWMITYTWQAGRQGPVPLYLTSSQGCLKPEYPLLDLHYQPALIYPFQVSVQIPDHCLR